WGLSLLHQSYHHCQVPQTLAGQVYFLLIFYKWHVHARLFQLQEHSFLPPTFTSMFKMPYTCKYHGNVVFICLFNRIFITNRTTRLNNSCYTSFSRSFYCIIHWEKGIRS